MGHNLSDIAHAEEIDQLIESGFDINSKDANGITLLHKFTKKGNLIGVKSLLQHEADFNVIDKESRNPLHYAIMHRHKKIAKLLINQLTVNSRDKNGFTPLHLAALQDDTELIDLLIAKGAKVNAKDNQEGYTTLHIASLYGSKKSVQILVDKEANLEIKDNYSHTPLFSVIYHCATHYESRVEIIEYLIKRGANVEATDTENNTMLFLAAYNNQMQIVKLITKKQGSNSKIKCKEFVSTKNKQGFDSLDCAIEHGNEKMIKFLISKGINVKDQDSDNNTRLHKASYNGNYKSVKLLLKLKVDVNAVAKSGSTSLHLATKKWHIKIVKMLLAAGADMSVQGIYGYTSLHLAIQKNYFDIAQLLIEKGANLNIECDDNYTPIDIFINKASSKEKSKEAYKKFCKFLMLYLKEQHDKYKSFFIFFIFALSITIVGLPFIIKSISKYREKSKTYKKTRTMLENLLYT